MVYWRWKVVAGLCLEEILRRDHNQPIDTREQKNDSCESHLRVILTSDDIQFLDLEHISDRRNDKRKQNQPRMNADTADQI
jgi:hypothetical protein